MTTLNVPVELHLEVRVHPIEGGGVWGEVARFPGCLAQAATVEDLVVNIRQAIPSARGDAAGLLAALKDVITEAEGKRAMAQAAA